MRGKDMDSKRAQGGDRPDVAYPYLWLRSVRISELHRYVISGFLYCVGRLRQSSSRQEPGVARGSPFDEPRG